MTGYIKSTLEGQSLSEVKIDSSPAVLETWQYRDLPWLLMVVSLPFWWIDDCTPGIKPTFRSLSRNLC